MHLQSSQQCSQCVVFLSGWPNHCICLYIMWYMYTKSSKASLRITSEVSFLSFGVNAGNIQISWTTPRTKQLLPGRPHPNTLWGQNYFVPAILRSLVWLILPSGLQSWHKTLFLLRLSFNHSPFYNVFSRDFITCPLRRAEQPKLAEKDNGNCFH